MITTTARIPQRNTMDLAICATLQPTAAAASAAVRVPVLWLERPMQDEGSRAYAQVSASKMIVWLNPTDDIYKQTEDALGRWLDGLPAR